MNALVSNLPIAHLTTSNTAHLIDRLPCHTNPNATVRGASRTRSNINNNRYIRPEPSTPGSALCSRAQPALNPQTRRSRPSCARASVQEICGCRRCRCCRSGRGSRCRGWWCRKLRDGILRGLRRWDRGTVLACTIPRMSFRRCCRCGRCYAIFPRAGVRGRFVRGEFGARG